jgi:predicted O-linked N-acetylglucosamine transferase (SPINDLY family)
VAYFFEPLLKSHDREKFEIFCYSDVKSSDSVTERLEHEADCWRAIAWKKDGAVIKQIEADNIDILVDLAGHTAGNRLPVFARKPAPIQVSWLGYPNTTGLESIDYRFTDAVADPFGRDDDYYSEELYRLPGCFLCYGPHENAPAVSESPSVENSIVTFGSFNNLSKITPEVINAWSKILLRVEDARLVLKFKSFNDEHVRGRYSAMFTEGGISSDKIDFLSYVPGKADHLSLYNKIDIALDPFPYNGTTTTCEALWMGVPVVALAGDRHASRVGASILNAVGLDETLVANDIESYIDNAVALAADRGALQELRVGLRQKMQDSPLCNAEDFTGRIEEAYQKMGLLHSQSFSEKVLANNISGIFC